MFLNCEPVPSLPGISPRKKKAYAHQNMYTKMFIASASTMAKNWKQPKYLSRDEEINKTVLYLCNGIIQQ